MKTMSNSTKFLIITLILGIGLRIFLINVTLADLSILTQNDQKDYIRLASGLVENKNYGAWFSGERVPLYPTFLAACHFISGSSLADSTLPEQTLITAVIIQNILGLFCVLIMYFAGRTISSVMGNLCAAFTVLNVNMAMYCNQILTEALFMPVMAFVWYAFIIYRQKSSLIRLCFLASLLGFGTLIRLVTMYIPFFLVPFLLLESQKSLKEKLIHAMVFCIVFASFLMPWIGRNFYVFGHAKMTSHGAAHIAGWVIPAIAQNEEKISLQAARKKHVQKWYELKRALPKEKQQDKFAVQEATNKFFLKYLKSVSPVSVVKAWVEGALKNLLVPIVVEAGYMFQMDWTHFSEISGSTFPEQAWNFVVHNKNRLFSALLIIGISLTLVFRLIQLTGMWLLLRSQPKILISGVLVILYFLAVNGPVGYAKYRLPFEPVLIFFTSVAVAALPLFRSRKYQF